MILPAAYRAPEAANEPVRIEMIDGGTEWWEILAAFGPTAIVAAALIAYLVQRESLNHQREALNQKTKSDSEAEWWRRVQWAIDAALANEDPKRQRIGLGMLNDAAKNPHIGSTEQRILLIVTDIILADPLRAPRLRRIGRRRKA